MIDEIYNKFKDRRYYWLNLDYWGIEHAAWLFLNVDPDSVNDNGSDIYMVSIMGEEQIFSYTRVGDEPFDDELEKRNCLLLDKYSLIFREYVNLIEDRKIMGGTLQDILDYRDSPSFWISKALSKKIEIPWIDYAIGEGYYDPNKVSSSLEKSLTEMERQTLLVIIAALAKEAKIDVNKTSKAGELIASITQQLGTPIGATTIETHLKKIPQALLNRAK